MFTGIIAGVGRTRSLVANKLTIALPPQIELPAVGESIAVNGVCLTVVRCDREKREIELDLSPETLRRTNLGLLRPGERVNLELPVAAGERLGGHFVLGHIDTLGRISKIVPQGGFYLFSFQVEPEFAHLLVEKGSVAVDGISLTAFNVRGGQFDVAIIPHTFRATNLQDRRPGDRVNVEFDILGKYVAKLLAEGEREKEKEGKEEEKGREPLRWLWSSTL